mmetsp:Transcript_596/g.926  ORF Transcript_596/g.926 Transcript_596/m.926 type:complete len:876 (-) Transcript_596:187-2814(-)
MMNSFPYYDNLREKSVGFTPIFQGNHLGRNLHRYDAPAGEDDSMFVMCHIPLFLRYTEMSGDDFRDNSALAYGGSAGAMLAMHHFNTGNGVIVKDIEGINNTCPIRFTTEIFDTQASPIPAVRGLTEMLTRSTASVFQPQPCAVMGTLYSSVSTKFATVTGVYDLLQVAPGASSDLLDNEAQYPLFSRTHPSDGGSAKLLPAYLQDVLNVTNFAIVYIADDGYGLSFVHVVQDYAKSHNTNVLSVPLSFYPHPTKEQIKSELEVLLKSDLNYVLGVFFSDNYAMIMEAAGELGVAGPGKMWLFCGAIGEYLYDQAQDFEIDSVLAKATYGNAVITDGGGAPGTTEHQNFVEVWKQMGEDTETLDYINLKQPLSPGGEPFTFNRTSAFFQKVPNHVALFSYDAIIGMGISACQAAIAANSTFTENDVFSGKDHHTSFLDIDFASASGEVRIGPTTFSRNESSTYYVVSNILDISSTKDTVSLQGEEYAFFDALVGHWKIFDGDDGPRQFIFSDGTFNLPPQIPEVEEDMNLISTGVRSFCLTLSVLTLVASAGFLIYTMKMRNKSVIKMAQPPFLAMICAGTMIMASAIIPLSMDEGVAVSQSALDASCSMTPWFFSFGFTITFVALFSKLWRVNKVIDAARTFRRVTITVPDVLQPLTVLIMCNAIILLVWEGVSPPHWERIPIEINRFGRVVSSEGSCTSENGIAYIAALLVINGIALILACYQAYIGRDIKTELNESSYICMAMICIFQACFFGVPLLFISSSNQSAYLYVATSICFVICMATLSFIFVPKIIAQESRDVGTQQFLPNASGVSQHSSQLSVRGRSSVLSSHQPTMPSSLLQLRAAHRAAKMNTSQNEMTIIVEEPTMSGIDGA